MYVKMYDGCCMMYMCMNICRFFCDLFRFNVKMYTLLTVCNFPEGFIKKSGNFPTQCGPPPLQIVRKNTFFKFYTVSQKNFPLCRAKQSKVENFFGDTVYILFSIDFNDLLQL